ncbi:uncharacterized protein LOC128956402 [Oppia nitens]|uniref:uncharacterized protein LOC128956402 n=1 Tax=Oppia nitens TaxID=1686743 RepID=UPI0023DC81E5|nr:uncharacterized protein LOC128956402 [Oppia nitens]
MCILIDVCFWCCVKDTDDYDNNVSSGGGGGGQGLLDRAGRMTHTELGQPVNDKLVTSLLSIEEQDREKLDWPSDWRLPYSRPFNEVSVITDRVLLSSVGAINRDNVRRYRTVTNKILANISML